MGAGPSPNTFYDQELHTIYISESTRLGGKATPEIIAEGVAFLHKDGIIVLENAIDVSHLEALNGIMSKEALEIAQDPNHHFNFGKNTRNMDQAPPPTPALMYKDVWCNPFVAAILAATLGPHPTIHYANGNTALQGTDRQPVHSDCEFAHPVSFPFAYVVNIPLVDTTAHNGATEVWPGSHHVSLPESHVSPDPTTDDDILAIQVRHLERRRTHSPPIRACTRRGSLVIRDLRLWHAGMANRSPEPRVMLAFVAQPAWFQARSRIRLPRSVQKRVESWEAEEGMRFSAEYVDGPVDHRTLSSLDVDFDTHSPVLNRYRAQLSTWPDYRPTWY